MDETVLQERTRAYRGSIACPLRNLRFENQYINPRQLDKKNIERILAIFELQGCLRLEPENSIPALIAPATLAAIVQTLPEDRRNLQLAGKKPAILSDVPQDIVCLHGQHRVEAAKRFLGPGEKWWVVDLYASDLSKEAQNALRENYPNAKNFYDGDIYRHLRRAHLRGDLRSKHQWLACLSTTKQRDVKQFEKRTTRSFLLKSFSDALDALIPFMGLWPAFYIGTFHRILPLRCHEELISYLRCVKTAWDTITNSAEQLANSLDATTVSILEGRCPQVAEDLEMIEQDTSKIFPLVKEPAARQAIWQRLRSIAYVIPSLHTFLEDTKYLEPCANILKKLLPQQGTHSVYQQFSRMHDGRCSLQEQHSEESWSLVPQPSAKDAYRRAYLQLWLYAMRHFPEMTGHAPRKDLSKAKPSIPKIEYVWWSGIANLATQCGFENIVQAYPTIADADHRMAKEFLANARPWLKFGISMDRTSSYVQQLVDIIRCVDNEDHMEESILEPHICSHSQECGADVSSRCGVPHEQSFQNDCKWLFLRYMATEWSRGPSTSTRYLTSFGVKKAMFHRFFEHEIKRDDHNSHSVLSGENEEMLRPDELVEDITVSEPFDRSGPIPDQAANQKRSVEGVEDITVSEPFDQSISMPDQAANHKRSAEETVDTSLAQGTAVLPASYSLIISNRFIQESNVNRDRAREIYRDCNTHLNTSNLIIIKAKSTALYDVLSIPRDHHREIVQCLGDEKAQYYLTSDRGKRLRMNAPNDIVHKTEQPVLVVSSEDEKQVRAWFEEEIL